MKTKSGSYSKYGFMKELNEEVGIERFPEVSITDDLFINYLNQIEGWKTKCKNLHWAAPNLNIHEKLDEFLSVLCEYQDALAEGYMGIFSKMRPDAIEPEKCSALNAKEFIEIVRERTLKFNSEIPDESKYAGIKSDNDAFVQNINKFVYLFGLCG